MNKNENSGGCLATLLIFVFMTPIFIGSLIGIGYGVYNIAKGSAEQKEKSQIEERIEIVEEKSQIEEKIEVEEEAQYIEWSAEQEEINIKREEFENEYALIIEKIKYTSLSVENIESYKNIKEETLKLKERYSEYLDVNRLAELEEDIISIENAISNLELELQKIEEEKQEKLEKEKQKSNNKTDEELIKEYEELEYYLENNLLLDSRYKNEFIEVRKKLKELKENYPNHPRMDRIQHQIEMVDLILSYL